MNLLIKVIKISKSLKAKSLAGRNSSRLKSIREYVWKTWPARRVARKDSLYCFLTSIFASYAPESFKIICFTCIWSKFVYASFRSSQNPQQNPCRISQFKTSWREADNLPGTGTSQIYLCTKFGGNRK